MAGVPNPIQWSEAIGRQIVDRIATGEYLPQIGRDPTMPCRRTILLWLARDKLTVDGERFSDAVWEARRKSHGALAEDVHEMADELRQLVHIQGDRSDAARIASLREALKAKQWLLERMHPTLYGQQVHHSGRVEGGNVQVVIYAPRDHAPIAPHEPTNPPLEHAPTAVEHAQPQAKAVEHLDHDEQSGASD